MENFFIRDKMQADEDFIFDSWLNNYQATSYFAKRMKKQTFMRFHPLIISNILKRPGVVVKIAGDNDYTIFGYIVAEPELPCVHYMYVRPEFQRFGIGRELFNEVGIVGPFEVSHWTPVLNDIHHKHRIFDFNPYRM